jgi:hypothetical protein
VKKLAFMNLELPYHVHHTAATMLRVVLHLLCRTDSPDFLQMTHTFGCILSIVREAGNPGIRSASDAVVEGMVVCGDAVL